MPDSTKNPEVDVTEEMLSAARHVLMENYLGLDVYDLRDPILAEIYREMDKSRHK